jgi:hypothetical protein
VKKIVRQRIAARKRRIERRLDRDDPRGCEQPMMQPHNIHYELARRTTARVSAGSAGRYVAAMVFPPANPAGGMAAFETNPRIGAVTTT